MAEETKDETQTTEQSGEQVTEKTEQVSEQVTEETENKEETTEEKQEPSEENKEEEKQEKVEEENIDSQEKADEVLTDKGFDYYALQEEYINNNGELSQETREALNKAGISNEMIDNFIAGQEARREVEINELSQEIGGREVFDEVLNWASNNLSKEELFSINKVKDKTIIKMILRDLKNSMEAKEGKMPEYSKGEGSKPSQDIFHSQAEMFEAVKDPKYTKDEYYRQQVMKKVAASREAGIELGL